MNAMTNFTLKSLRKNRARTFVTIVGVALAAALLTAVLTSYISLTDFLYREEAATSGTWMAKVDTDSEEELARGLASAGGDASVTGVATLRDVGFAELAYDQQQVFGQYQTIVSADGDMAEMLGMKAAQGRLPEKQGEILLYSRWSTDENVGLGDEISFQVGKRVAVSVGGEEDAQMVSGWSRVGAGDSGEGFETSIADGTELSSQMGLLDPKENDNHFDEALIGKQERTYTVVGFYDRVNYALYSGVGTIAVTVEEPPLTPFAETFLTMDGVTNSDEVREKAESLFPDSDIELHIAMLRYMGISSDASIWTTFYGLILILSVVIILTCISLIFNAFAISVAERIGQFGLLSSVGATRRQLRHAVILEALLIAAIGIPLGVLIGIGGCAITFAILGPAIAELAGNGSIPFIVKVEPTVIAATAVLALVTVLLSVWIPAKRASGANIIDSLRSSNGMRVSKKGAKAAAKATDPKKLWRTGGMSGRLFGMGGRLAYINRKRGTAKGRTAAVSLALAIVLLMTAGSLNLFLSTLVGAVTGGYASAGDIGVTAHFTTDERDLDAPIDPASLLERDNSRFADEAEAFEGAYGFLSESDGAIPKGWMLSSSATAVLPGEMAGKGLEASDDRSGYGGIMEDGDYATQIRIYYIDDAAFDEYARGIGLDPGSFYDADDPKAIGVKRAYGNNGSVYQLVDMLKDTGKIRVLASAVYMDRFPAYLSLMTLASDDMKTRIVPTVAHNGDKVDATEELSIEDVDVAEIGLEVAALADEPPAVVGGSGSDLAIVVPESLAQSQGFGGRSPVFRAEFDSTDGDHAALAETLSTRAGQYFKDVPFELAFSSYNDHIAEVDSAQMMATIVNVFCLLFTVILALIAMANVFNTVTNSLILRRREFAVMRSIGLSNRQFHRLIANECMHFGVAGLIPGMVVSVGISYLLFMAVGNSIEGMAFSLPWGYVALAIGMTALAVGISVAYGMRRCKADSVVEALRSE